MQYFDMILAAGTQEVDRLVSAIMHHFHGSMKCYERGSPIAVAFPKWRHHKDPRQASFGSIMRFFGDPVWLANWQRHPALEPIDEAGAIDMGALSQSPEGAPHVRFVRNRKLERDFWKQPENRRQICAFPPAFYAGPKGGGFKIAVDMVPCDRCDGELTSYGLSKGQSGASVPYF